MQVALPQNAAHGVGWRVPVVHVLDVRIHLEDPTYADDDPPPVVNERGLLGIEEDEGLLRCDSTEEGIEHGKLISTLLHPRCRK